MRRAAIALVWLAGATVPLLVATIFFFGCCVLPFHRFMHKVVPLCSLVMNLGKIVDEPRDASTPAGEKQEPVKRFAAHATPSFSLKVRLTTVAAVPAIARSHRSFIAHGALRCDQDVGLHVLIDTFRI